MAFAIASSRPRADERDQHHAADRRAAGAADHVRHDDPDGDPLARGRRCPASAVRTPPEPNPVRNKLVLDRRRHDPVERRRGRRSAELLAGCCAETARDAASSPSCSSSPRPTPATSARRRVLQRRSSARGVTKFGFVGNERYRELRQAVPRSVALRRRLVGAHRRAGERLGLEQQLVVGRALRQALAADHHHAPAPPAG